MLYKMFPWLGIHNAWHHRGICGSGHCWEFTIHEVTKHRAVSRAHVGNPLHMRSSNTAVQVMLGIHNTWRHWTLCCTGHVGNPQYMTSSNTVLYRSCWESTIHDVIQHCAIQVMLGIHKTWRHSVHIGNPQYMTSSNIVLYKRCRESTIHDVTKHCCTCHVGNPQYMTSPNTVLYTSCWESTIHDVITVLYRSCWESTIHDIIKHCVVQEMLGIHNTWHHQILCCTDVENPQYITSSLALLYRSCLGNHNTWCYPGLCCTGHPWEFWVEYRSPRFFKPAWGSSPRYDLLKPVLHFIATLVAGSRRPYLSWN
jgi:hypothetical protein